MPPKKPKKEEEPDDEFMKMSASDLQQNLTLFKDRLNDLKSKRNYIQMDRDMVQQYYQNTQAEIEKLKLQILNSETEAQTMQKNHNTEVKVYLQKVRHLEYEQERANREIQQDGENAKTKQKEYYQRRSEVMKNVKHDFKKKHVEQEKKNIENCESEEKAYRQREVVWQNEYRTKLVDIEKKFEERLAKLKEELELKLKVEIHEVEERKNLHINKLISNHEANFKELKDYYNNITSDHLKIIKDLKAEIKKFNEEAEANKKRIADMRTDNNELKKPLEDLRRDCDKLKTLLKQFEKHKMSLQNYKSKYQVLLDKIIKLQKDSQELNDKLTKLDGEKKNLEDKFDKIALEVKRHADTHNHLLKQRLHSCLQKFQQKKGQLHQVIQNSNMDPQAIDQISERVRNSVQSKNNLIKNLNYSIHHAIKAYNDAIRVYEAKLVEFGIPAEELGFQPLETVTSTMPAGLVSS